MVVTWARRSPSMPSMTCLARLSRVIVGLGAFMFLSSHIPSAECSLLHPDLETQLIRFSAKSSEETYQLRKTMRDMHVDVVGWNDGEYVDVAIPVSKNVAHKRESQGEGHIGGVVDNSVGRHVSALQLSSNLKDIVDATKSSFSILSNDIDTDPKFGLHRESESGSSPSHHGRYHYLNVPQIEAKIKNLASHHSAIAKLEVLGKSIQNRDILAVKVGKGGKDQPNILVTGAHHAREWISYEVPLHTLETLLNKYAGQESAVVNLLNTRTIWFIPLLNPDGVEESQERERMWRKNKRKNPDGTFGVDLNRNYGFKWTKSNEGTDSEVYEGESPFSEPETQIVKELAQRERFTLALAYHSHGNQILWPWCFSKQLESMTQDDADAIHGIGHQFANMLHYKGMASADDIETQGEFIDYMYGEVGALTFTVELGNEFSPPMANVVEMIKASNTQAFIWLAGTARPLPSRRMRGTTAPATPTTAPPAPANADASSENHSNTGIPEPLVPPSSSIGASSQFLSTPPQTTPQLRRSRSRERSSGF